MIRICKWDATFENASTRKLAGPIRWYSCPSDRESSGYRKLARLGEPGAIALGIMHSLCGILCTLPRKVRASGVLQNSAGDPMTMEDLEDLTRFPSSILTPALATLESIGWIDQSATVLPSPDSTVAGSGSAPSHDMPSGEERRGEERKGEEGKGDAVAPPEIPPHSFSMDGLLADLRATWPDSPAHLTGAEMSELSMNRAVFLDYSPEDWTAAKAYIAAPDRIRNHKLWPRSRAEHIQNASEALERIRTFWKARGRSWWNARQSTTKPATPAPEPTPTPSDFEDATAATDFLAAQLAANS